MSFNDVVARMICKSRYVRTVKGAPRALPWLSRDIFLVRKNANFFSFAHYSILLFSLDDLLFFHFVPIIPYVWRSATQREHSTYLVAKYS